MYAFSKVENGMFTSPHMRYGFGGWQAQRYYTNDRGQPITNPLQLPAPDAFGSKATTNPATAPAAITTQTNSAANPNPNPNTTHNRLVDVPKYDETQEWAACCHNTGPMCNVVHGIPEQEQPTNTCTDMLPWSLVNKTLLLQFCASTQNTEAEPLSSLYRIVFQSDCECDLVSCGHTVRCSYQWYRDWNTQIGELFISTLNGAPLLMSAAPMKIYKALSVELRAGTQSYGTAYCEAGFAN